MELDRNPQHVIETDLDPNIAAIMHAGLDPANPSHRAYAQSIEAWARSIDPATFKPYRSAEHAKRLANSALLWERWATLPVSDGGGGIAPNAAGLVALPPKILTVAVTAYLGWLGTDVAADHPLVNRTNTAGMRRRHERLGSGSRRSARKAVLVWAEEHGCDAAALAADLDSIIGHDRERVVERVKISAADLGSMLDVLDAEAVDLSFAKGIRAKAWHARQKAALLVQVWGVLRLGELGRLQLDKMRVRNDGTLTIRLAETKGLGARDVDLVPRGDRFCPIDALMGWVNVAREAGYDLNGRLLPVVGQTRSPGRQAVRRATYSTEHNNFNKVTEAAGVKTPEITADRHLVLGTHALRRVLTSAAGNKGKSMAFITALGGGAWAEGSPAPGNAYVVMDPDTTEMLTGLVDGIHGGPDGQE